MEGKNVVIDVGSKIMKVATTNNNNRPEYSSFSSVVGYDKEDLKNNINNVKNYVGDEVQSMKEILSINYPVQHGNVSNWDEMLVEIFSS